MSGGCPPLGFLPLADDHQLASLAMHIELLLLFMTSSFSGEGCRSQLKCEQTLLLSGQQTGVLDL